MLDSHRTIVRGAGSIILASVLFVSGATTPAWAEDASARAGKDIAGNVLQGRRGLGRGEVREEWGHARPAPIVAQPADHPGSSPTHM